MRKAATTEMQTENCLDWLLAGQMAMTTVHLLDSMMDVHWEHVMGSLMASKKALPSALLMEMNSENCLDCLLAGQMAMTMVHLLDSMMDVHLGHSMVSLMASKKALLSALMKDMNSECSMERYWEHLKVMWMASWRASLSGPQKEMNLDCLLGRYWEHSTGRRMAPWKVLPSGVWKEMNLDYLSERYWGQAMECRMAPWREFPSDLRKEMSSDCSLALLTGKQTVGLMADRMEMQKDKRLD